MPGLNLKSNEAQPPAISMPVPTPTYRAAPPPVPPRRSAPQGAPPSPESPAWWGKSWRCILVMAWLAGLIVFGMWKEPVLAIMAGLVVLISGLVSFGLLQLVRVLWRANKALCIILTLLLGLIPLVGALPAYLLVGVATILGMRKFFPLYLVVLVILSAAVFMLPGSPAPEITQEGRPSPEGTSSGWTAPLDRARQVMEQVRTRGEEASPSIPPAPAPAPEATGPTAPAGSDSTAGRSSTAEPARIQTSSNLPDQAWAAAEALIPVIGVMEHNGNKVVLIDNDIKRVGETVEVVHQRKTYRFRVARIHLDSVRFEPAQDAP